jgi:ferredoxin
MTEKYNVPVKITPPRFKPIGKYSIIEFREDCAGSCKQCVKKKCVYNNFSANREHISAMKEPEYLYTCSGCFRCVQECTKGIFSRVINPEYKALGDDYWRADIIIRLWYQAHTGNIPVSGSGYGGPFTGEGFDSVWTDMSEIVRPTRDGIHGREYINTCFELSERFKGLGFKDDMTLVKKPRKILEVPIPLLLTLPKNFIINKHIILAVAKAAFLLKTFFLINCKDYTPNLSEYKDNLIPCLKTEELSAYKNLILASKAILIEYSNTEDIINAVSGVRSFAPNKAVIIKAPLNKNADKISSELADKDVDTIYFYADDQGKELNGKNSIFLKDSINRIHTRLVSELTRQNINLIFSGGIAMAEHVAKAIIFGADAVAADISIMLAMECRLCKECAKEGGCPVKLDEEFDADNGASRIANLFGAWHGQLLEVMGAMGIREARRLRGEIGRSIRFENMEKDIFEPIFKRRSV